MAITKLDFPTASTPSYTPTLATDYNNQNEIIERNARGYNAISLTNWDATTTKPQIDAGSVIEINGSTYDITTDTDIDTSGASSGTIYVYFDDGTPEFKFLDTAPTWSATLNGWYTSGDRWTGHRCTWDGASSYTVKVTAVSNTQLSDDLFNDDDGIYIDGDIIVDTIYTDNVKLKVKYLTGTTNVSTYDLTVAHGIASGMTYIMSVGCSYDAGSIWLKYPVDGATESVRWDNTNLYLFSGSSAMASKDIRFVVFYRQA